MSTLFGEGALYFSHEAETVRGASSNQTDGRWVIQPSHTITSYDLLAGAPDI